jgi:hypothetical protein
MTNLEELLKNKKFQKSLDIYLQVSQGHSPEIYNNIRSEIFKKYNLNEAQFLYLYDRYIQKYIETERYKK